MKIHVLRACKRNFRSQLMRKRSSKRKKKYWTEGGRGLEPILEEKTKKKK
jgi:hypothetical protein